MRSADSPASQPSPRCPAAPVAAGDAVQRKPPESGCAAGARRASCASAGIQGDNIASLPCQRQGSKWRPTAASPCQVMLRTTPRHAYCSHGGLRQGLLAKQIGPTPSHKVDPPWTAISDPTPGSDSLSDHRIAAPTRTRAVITDHQLIADPTLSPSGILSPALPHRPQLSAKGTAARRPPTVIFDPTWRVITDLGSDPSR